MRPFNGRFRWSIAALSMVLVVSACGTSSSSPSGSAAATAPAGSPAATSSAAAGASASAEPSAITGAKCAADAVVVKFWTRHTPPDSDALDTSSRRSTRPIPPSASR